MKWRSQRGFTLVEFVVAIVFIGVVLGPLLVFVARIHDLNSAIGQQARKEAWRSFVDQAIVAGVDPNRATALTRQANPAIPAIAGSAIAEIDRPPVSGLPRIVALRAMDDVTIAEPRITAAGLQIGAGAPVPPRISPTGPLTPIVMPIPVVTPADGAIIATSELAPADVGQPYTLTVQAAASAGTSVTLALNQPFATKVGPSLAQHVVSATDLLHRVNGKAWSEYPGNIDGGDRSVALPDGRIRWLVTRADGRLQIYEPSSNATFAYTLSLGAPVILRDTNEHVSGTSLAFDYSEYYAIQKGTTALRIDYSAAVQAVFGSHWTEQAIGFQCSFHDAAGPFSGDLRSFFLPDKLDLWADTLVVAATGVVPQGASSPPASWTFNRSKTPLGTPVVSNSADGAGMFTPGDIQFSAPAGPDGNALGRLSFENGSTVSTGTTLSIAVIP